MTIHGMEDDLLVRLMSASTQRAKVIANNIANQNTPGYHRKVLRFEELLQAAIETRVDPREVAPSVEEDLLTPARADGNNVNMELEMNALRQNRILYETYAAIMTTRFEVLRSSIDSGR